MKIKNKDLIAELNSMVHRHLNAAEKYKVQSTEVLNWKAAPDSWSILECIEHLNRYSDFYLQVFQNSIDTADKVEENHVFRSGWLGNYFAESMLPKEGMKTMDTFKDKNPNGSKLTVEVLNKFIRQQKQLLDLLEKGRKINLSKARNPITISKLITLRLGDSFRFLINHAERHIVQADRAYNKAIHIFEGESQVVSA